MKRIEKVYRGNSDNLWRFVRRRTPDDDSAFDIVQESFLRFAQNDEVKEGSERAWLFVTARRLLIDRIRFKSRLVSYEADDDFKSDSEEEPAELLLRKEDLEWLSSELDGLESEDKDLLEMHYTAQMSLSEAAFVLEISEVNARVRLHRLRKYLKGRYDETHKTF